jgi:hypothetical protein
MRAAAVVTTLVVAAVLVGCGSGAAHGSAPPSCRAVVARTLHGVTARIEARAALHRHTPGDVPTLVAALTRPAPGACGVSTAATVADTVGAVGERLVRAEATGPEAARALRLVAHDPRFVSAVRRRDAAALRAAIVRFFRMKQLHIVRVRATTPGGRLVGDVGGPYVLAPASRAIRDRRGRMIGRLTLSVQDDAGFIKLMRRFTGAGVVLRTASAVVPGSSPPRTPHAATFAFTTRAFPHGPLHVSVLVPRAGPGAL